MKTQAEMSADWRKRNPEKSRASQKNWLKNNRSNKAAYLKLYYQQNKEKLLMKAAQRSSAKMSDPVFALAKRLRTLLNLNLRKQGYTKKSRTFKIVGLSQSELLHYLWSNFEKRYGISRSEVSLKDLHIDHIIPQSSAKTEEELLKLYHYSNLQFLFAKDNLSKGARIE